MTSETALLWVLIGLVALTALLSLFTLRAVVTFIRDSTDRDGENRVAVPDRGFSVSLDDPLTWPSGASRIFDDEVWVALVVRGCMACQILREEFDSDRRAYPDLIVIGGPDGSSEETRAYLDESWHFAAERIVSPMNLESLTGLGSPNEFPTLIALRGGVVVASAHRLAHLRAKLVGSSMAARA